MSFEQLFPTGTLHRYISQLQQRSYIHYTLCWFLNHFKAKAVKFCLSLHFCGKFDASRCVWSLNCSVSPIMLCLTISMYFNSKSVYFNSIIYWVWEEGFGYVWLEGSFRLLEEDDVKTLWGAACCCCCCCSCSCCWNLYQGFVTWWLKMILVYFLCC